MRVKTDERDAFNLLIAKKSVIQAFGKYYSLYFTFAEQFCVSQHFVHCRISIGVIDQQISLCVCIEIKLLRQQKCKTLQMALDRPMRYCNVFVSFLFSLEGNGCIVSLYIANNIDFYAAAARYGSQVHIQTLCAFPPHSLTHSVSIGFTSTMINDEQKSFNMPRKHKR